uniref:Putative 4-amino-4-deoxy-L-arabinose-phosphoundecaprenol flippase subunit ArnE n=1 Tax=Anthurium amnicola TaxID=1678845 RepID=A0A1D1ZGD4_9ARAE
MVREWYFPGMVLEAPRQTGVPPMVVDAKRKGYGWAAAAGLCAALAAVSAKLFSNQLLKYGLVVLWNVTMWGCYVNSLKALSSLQATVTNFATNFLSSGLAGYFLFEETLSSKWFAGALFIVLGVFILSKSSVEEKTSAD